MSASFMTIRDIINAKSLDTDSYEIVDMIERVAQWLGEDYFRISRTDLFINPYRIEIKGRRNYDDRRGAVVYVMYYEDEVISIGSFAGRELDDVSNVIIYNHELVCKLIDMFKNQEEARSDVFDSNEKVQVCYWEGSPIVLGENLYGID